MSWYNGVSPIECSSPVTPSMICVKFICGIPAVSESTFRPCSRAAVIS